MTVAGDQELAAVEDLMLGWWKIFQGGHPGLKT